MSLLMVLLTGIIIFAGSFASWTVKGGPGVPRAAPPAGDRRLRRVRFADLFLFLFCEIAVFLMYPDRHLGLERRGPPARHLRWAMRRTGVGTRIRRHELTLYLLFGSAFILVGILALLRGVRIVLVFVPQWS
jgi:hypothetical protein